MKTVEDSWRRLNDFLDDTATRGIDLGEFAEDLRIVLDISKPKALKKAALKDPAGRARNFDPATSVAAGASISQTVADTIYREIVYLPSMLFLGATDEYIRDALSDKGFEFSESTVRSRRAELVEAGWVEANPSVKGTTKRGNAATLWRLSAKGLRALRGKKSR